MFYRYWTNEIKVLNLLCKDKNGLKNVFIVIISLSESVANRWKWSIFFNMLSVALFYNEMKFILYFQSPRCFWPHIYASKTIYALGYFMHTSNFSPHHAIGMAMAYMVTGQYMGWQSDNGKEGEDGWRRKLRCNAPVFSCE